jgi:hypothetical protein
MTYWLQYIALKVVILSVLLTATVLFAIRYPAMWMPAEHAARFPSVPIELFAVTRFALPALLTFGWFAYFMAAHRLGRPQ